MTTFLLDNNQSAIWNNRESFCEQTLSNSLQMPAKYTETGELVNIIYDHVKRISFCMFENEEVYQFI